MENATSSWRKKVAETLWLILI